MSTSLADHLQILKSQKFEHVCTFTGGGIVSLRRIVEAIDTYLDVKVNLLEDIDNIALIDTGYIDLYFKNPERSRLLAKLEHLSTPALREIVKERF